MVGMLTSLEIKCTVYDRDVQNASGDQPNGYRE